MFDTTKSHSSFSALNADLSKLEGSTLREHLTETFRRTLVKTRDFHIEAVVVLDASADKQEDTPLYEVTFNRDGKEVVKKLDFASEVESLIEAILN
jgi:hypothetical protein